MKRTLLLLVLAIGLLWTGISEAAYQVVNPNFAGIPIMVTSTASTDVTSTPTAVNGSTLSRVGCVITNPNTSFNVYVTFASTTYTAKSYIDADRCIIIPPGGSVELSGANWTPGPWASSELYGKTMYAYVSPTPLTVAIGFWAYKYYNAR